MPYTMWDYLKDKYPEAMQVKSWQHYYDYRIRTGGTPEAATRFANYMTEGRT